MSFSIVRPFRQSDSSGRRRPGRCAINVEPMEARALLTSAAVTSAIASVQQAEVFVQQEINMEIATLRSNIVAIEHATSAFIASHKSESNLAIRDEKFAIGQQLFLISVLDQTEGQYKATLNAGISGLKSGRLDPRTVPSILTTGEDNLKSEISTIGSTATFELSGLTGTFAAGRA